MNRQLGDMERTRLHDEGFEQLMARVRDCRLCPRMLGRARVFGPANGDPRADVLFVAEAPGRYGADRWQIPLYGDQTGRNFESLLEAAGLDRGSIFITNSVLCNPRDHQGRNAPPTTGEVANCSAHLRDTIDIVQPRYVVALGRVALQALQAVARHEMSLARDVGCPRQWYSRWLIALYHPGPRARLHRSAPLQMEDYYRLGELIRRGGDCPTEASGPARP